MSCSPLFTCSLRHRCLSVLDDPYHLSLSECWEREREIRMTCSAAYFLAKALHLFRKNVQVKKLIDFKMLKILLTGKLMMLTVLHPHSWSVPIFILSSGDSSQKHQNQVILNCARVWMSVCVDMWVHCVIRWSGVYSKVIFCLTLSVPGTGHKFNQDKDTKWMDNWIKELKAKSLYVCNYRHHR